MLRLGKNDGVEKVGETSSQKQGTMAVEVHEVPSSSGTEISEQDFRGEGPEEAPHQRQEISTIVVRELSSRAATELSEDSRRERG